MTGNNHNATKSRNRGNKCHIWKTIDTIIKRKYDFVTTTIINKFQAAVNELASNPLESPNIFVLIDEAHRTQYGVFNVNMERGCLMLVLLYLLHGTPIYEISKKYCPKIWWNY